MTSIGIVRHQAAFSQSAQSDGLSGRTFAYSFALFRDDSWSAAEQRYLKALDLAPGINQLLGSKGRIVRGEAELATVRTASDISYSASSYAGENFRIVGDAAGKFYCTTSNARF